MKQSVFRLVRLHFPLLYILAFFAFLLGVVFLNLRNFEHEAEEIRQAILAERENRMIRVVGDAVSLIEQARQTARRELRRELHLRVDDVAAMTESLFESNASRMGDAEAREMLVRALRDVGMSEGRGGFFIFRQDGTSILAGPGFDLFRTPEGRPLLDEALDRARKSGEGFIEFEEDVPGRVADQFLRIAYIRSLPELGWVIGSSEYYKAFEGLIKREVVEDIRRTFRGTEIFGGTWKGVTLLGPGLGRNMINLEDINGVQVVRELIRASQEGGGFVDYVMPNIDGSRSALKRSFVMGVPEWKWYIGTGEYLDDIEQVIANERAGARRELYAKLITLTGVLLVFSGAFFYLLRRLGMGLARDFSAFESFFRSHEKGVRIDTDGLSLREFGEMAEKANRMVEMRAESEDARLRSERSYREIFDASLDCIFILDLESGSIVDVNSAVETMFGAARESLLGKRPEAAFRQDVDEKGRLDTSEILKWVKTKDIHRFEWRTYHSDGSRLWNECMARRASVGGEDRLLVISRDIKARREREEELRRTNALLASIIEQAPFGILVVEETEPGRRALAITGTEALRLLGPLRQGTLPELPLTGEDGREIPPQLQPPLRAMDERRLISGEIFIVRGGDGTERPVSVRSAPVTGTGGKVVAGVAVISDISAEVRAREEAERISEFQRLVTEASSHLIKAGPEAVEPSIGEALLEIAQLPGVDRAYLFRFSEDGRSVRCVHHATEAGNDVPADLAREIPVSDIPHWQEAMEADGVFMLSSLDDLPATAGKFRDILEGVGTGSLLDVIIRSEGRHVGFIGIAAKSSPVEWMPLLPLMRVTAEIIANALERKASDERTHYMRGLLQGIIDSMPSVVIGVDESSRVSLWNVSAETLFGVTRKAAEGSALFDAAPDIGFLRSELASALEHREIRRLGKVEMDRPRRLIADVTVFPLLVGEGAVLRLDDVTTQASLESLMVQTEKMMSVGGLAAGMAHEINNPLGVITQSIQNIERRMTGSIAANEAAAEEAGVSVDGLREYMRLRNIPRYLDAMRDSALRASKIIQNMLDFSRHSDSGKGYFNLAEILDKSVELSASDYDLKKQYDFKHIEIIREYDESLPDVLCVRTEIEQVLLNLLRNAAQAMAEFHPDRPRITLRLRREGDEAVMEVQDNGPGLTSEQRDRIFEPFYTTKPAGRGTGLGLSVSYFIITQNHGGMFTVFSEPGEGARFVIRLPMGSVGTGQSGRRD